MIEMGKNWWNTLKEMEKSKWITQIRHKLFNGLFTNNKLESI